MSKSKSKSHTRGRRVVVTDPTLPLLAGIEMVPPPPFTPPSRAKQRAYARDKAERLAAERERSQARAQAHADRLARRPQSMQSNYALPRDVRGFFARLWSEWGLYHGPTTQPDEPAVPADEVRHLLEAAYMEGCRQGYIEGFVVRREPDRTRSIKANAGKRKSLVTVGTRTMTRDERDAAMVAEYAALRQLMKHTPACQRLAGKYEYESWQGVAGAIKRFRQRAGE